MTEPTTSPSFARRSGWLVISLCALSCCSGPQHTIRVTSEPIGAHVYVFRLRIHGVTPYEFFGLEPTDRILIGMAGYKDWTGRVENLSKAGRGTYKAELQPAR